MTNSPVLSRFSAINPMVLMLDSGELLYTHQMSKT